ncbi:MAG: hypothetical protein UJ210_06700 [Massilimicrobiota sp.]|mgnify:FL=1|nr:hypothetical protein [Massilimicrobiota sp.]
MTHRLMNAFLISMLPLFFIQYNPLYEMVVIDWLNLLACIGILFYLIGVWSYLYQRRHGWFYTFLGSFVLVVAKMGLLIVFSQEKYLMNAMLFYNVYVIFSIGLMFYVIWCYVDESQC